MDSDDQGLASASIFVMSGSLINPATITFISVPDYDYAMSGTITTGGSADYFVGISKGFESSWSIRGVFNSEFTSDWRIGEGEYYWYRVEGSCGEMKCDTSGIYYPDCKSMTVMTVVAARNLIELCDKLKNPSINPELNLRVRTIKKYSRPASGTAAADECNLLEEQEFCQIAECLDFCLDEDVRQKMSFSMRPIEATRIVEMTGTITVYGQVQTNKHKAYEPQFPVIGLSGSSECKIILSPPTQSGTMLFSGYSETVSSSYNFESTHGVLDLGGFAATSSPNRRYTEVYGGFVLSGGSRFAYAPTSSGGPQFSGSSESFLSLFFELAGKIEMGGRILEYSSPKYFHGASGILSFSGDSSYNFSHLGTVNSNISIGMFAFDLGSESSNPSYSSNLTIADNSISPSCGCGPVGMSLSLRHNIGNSSFLSSFLDRSGNLLESTLQMRYRSRDSSWRHAKHIRGRGRDGVSIEDIGLFFSISCLEGFWKFSFSALSSNASTGDTLRSGFILDIPADLICSDGSISTSIELDIKTGEFQAYTGQSLSAVDPPRPLAFNPSPRRIDVFVDGIFSDKRVYYDEIGLFKDSYWNSNPLKMHINPASGVIMPRMELSRIFE